MRLNCPHCMVTAIGRENPRTIDEDVFWTLSRHINAVHRDQTFICQRRIEAPRPTSIRTQRDFWQTEPNGDRTCSYCGSLHEDDFRSILQGFVANKQGYRFATTEKPDKIYANRPGVNNSRQGGTKFFLQHVTTSTGGDALHTLGALFEEALKRLDASAASSK